MKAFLYRSLRIRAWAWLLPVWVLQMAVPVFAEPGNETVVQGGGSRQNAVSENAGVSSNGVVSADAADPLYGSVSADSALSENSAQDEELMAILSGLTWSNWAISHIEGVREQLIPVRFIDKNGMVSTRALRVYFPPEAAGDVPLVYVAHYEVGEYSLEGYNYLQHGWAVASPAFVNVEANETLLEDDLVFNNAALYTLRHMKGIDKRRIAVTGTSAGGYTALMLDALQMGGCAYVANAAVINPYYNFHQYFAQTDRVNFAALPADKAWLRNPLVYNNEEWYTEFSAYGMAQPMPLPAVISGQFQGVRNAFPDVADHRCWEALSPVGLSGCFSSPVMLNHYTSDVLSPIAQLTDRYVYPKDGPGMPKGVSTQLNRKNPGVLGKPLGAVLPAERTAYAHIPVTDPYQEIMMPYDPAAFFQINIYDDGPTQSYGGHNANAEKVFEDDTAYLSEMFSRTLAVTEQLNEEKLLLLLRRYMGVSVQLPVHYGVDESAYGSLTVYRDEIVDEMALYAQDHTLDVLEFYVLHAICGKPDAGTLQQAWEEIRYQISSGK